MCNTELIPCANFNFSISRHNVLFKSPYFHTKNLKSPLTVKVLKGNICWMVIWSKLRFVCVDVAKIRSMPFNGKPSECRQTYHSLISVELYIYIYITSFDIYIFLHFKNYFLKSCKKAALSIPVNSPSVKQFMHVLQTSRHLLMNVTFALCKC